MSLPRDPADRHRAVAATFAEVTHAVADWDAPTPVPEWRARDVVGHLVEWLAGFLASSSDVRLPEVPVDDPVAAWQRRSADVQSLLDDPGTAGRTLANPHTGDLPLPEAIDRFYTSDVLMHAWDLARAAGLTGPDRPGGGRGDARGHERDRVPAALLGTVRAGRHRARRARLRATG